MFYNSTFTSRVKLLVEERISLRIIQLRYLQNASNDFRVGLTSRCSNFDAITFRYNYMHFQYSLTPEKIIF